MAAARAKFNRSALTAAPVYEPDKRRHTGVALGGRVMADIERRALMKGAALGALAFTVGGTTVMLTAGQARARNVPFRMLKENEADAIAALGETLVPGARDAGIAHFIDHQISVPAEQALLQARILHVRPPFANFYRAAIGAVDRASEKVHGSKFAQLPADKQREFVGLMRQNKVEGWQGPQIGRAHV